VFLSKPSIKYSIIFGKLNTNRQHSFFIGYKSYLNPSKIIEYLKGDVIFMDSKGMLEMKKWAVVGATPDPNRFGYKIYKKLKRNGYDVYPVNPKYSEIDGNTVYSTIEDLPEKPEVVNFVINPEIGIKILESLKNMNIENLWLQPGTVSKEILNYTENHNINAVRSCVLIELDD